MRGENWDDMYGDKAAGALTLAACASPEFVIG